MTHYAINSQNASFTFLHANDSFLKSIDLKIVPGECVLICGESGSGKTTFSRLLNGISPNHIEGELSGDVNTEGLVAGKANIEDYVPVVGSVFQNPKTQHFTVNTTYELAFPLENMGLPTDQIKNRITEVTNELNFNGLLNRNIFKLSGGEKQQIAMASANMLKPNVLVLDEVTSNLDQESIERMRQMIKRKKKEGVTVILTEHRLAWTKDFVDRYVLFEEGRRVDEWTAQEFDQLSNKELGDMGLRSMDLSRQNAALPLMEQDSKVNAENQTLQTQNLTVGYDKKTPVLSNINIGLDQSEVVGLMGSNGTGKSTLANTLTGLLKPLDGKVLWNGKPISSKELIKKSFLVMQDTNYQLFSEDVSEEVLLNARYPERKNQVLKQLNLSNVQSRHPMSLSGGQKQRVAIASAMLSGKELIIFDEPTSGLDYVNMQQFGKLLELLKDTDAVIAIITHDVELAADWCDSIINLGKL